MKYVSDVIESEYTNWKAGDTVFIKSPTGTGKSSFIFNQLLPFYASAHKKILYLVNRTILKDQICSELNANYSQYIDYITIESYQAIENEISKAVPASSESFQNLDLKNQSVTYSNSRGFGYLKYSSYDCVVCDEAHYFLMDSNYNTNTILSYDFVNYYFRNKIRIYMSATIDSIKDIIDKDNRNAKYWCTDWLKLPSDYVVDPLHFLKKTYEYSLKSDRDDISVHILRNKSELAEEVASGTDKWLIFVDNKDYGKRLKRDIEAAFKARDKSGEVVFVTSDYEDDLKATGEVYSISNDSKQTANVLIATSVLDNGINLKDLELRNLVIITDTYTQFIQMLGRKRKDGLPINLYIMQLGKDHFDRRRRLISRFIDIIEIYHKPVCDRILDNFKVRQQFNSSLVPRQINYFEYNRFEHSLLTERNQFILSSILNSYSEYEAIRAAYLYFGNILRPNRLSILNLYNLLHYYSYVIDLFESGDETAFLKVQLSWLGKGEQESAAMIDSAFMDRLEHSRSIIIEEFQSVIDNNDVNECNIHFIQELLTEIKDRHKNKFYDVLEVAKDKEDYSTYKNIVEHKKKTVSKQFIQFLNDNCGIPFTLKAVEGKKSVLCFQRTEDQNYVK